MSVQNLTPGVMPIGSFDRELIASEWDWFWAGKSTAIVPGLAPERTLGFFKEAIIKDGAQGAEIITKPEGPLGLGYDRTNTGGAANLEVAAGSAFETQYEFRGNEPWTVCVVFQVYNSAADDRSIISRFDDPAGGGTSRNFLLRLDLGAAPQNLEVYQADATVRITGGNVIELDTPYLVVVRCDGSNNGSLLTFDLNTHSLVDDLTGSFPGTSTMGANEYIAFFGRTGSDPWSGTGWMASFHDFKMSRTAVMQLARDPFGPIRPDLRIIGKAPVVAGGLSIPVAMHDYRSRRVA